MAIWIGALVLALLALGLAGLVLRAQWLYRRRRAWPTTTGKVALTGLDSERRIHRHAARLVHLPTVAYRYQAGGRNHIGSRLATREIVFEQEAAATAFLARFPAGAPVTVHYDPASPNQAVLEVRPPAVAVPLAVAGLAAVGAVLLVSLGGA
ncbi:DUF3592 domain-containing protein [Zavarzinia compransoris]|nr:DUF3592 domain-containing protein [Zavarzinia compransoris]TDP47202.1 uncharacterized protein DUF3592 [Zavarzinia compransoris]